MPRKTKAELLEEIKTLKEQVKSLREMIERRDYELNVMTDWKDSLSAQVVNMRDTNANLFEDLEQLKSSFNKADDTLKAVSSLLNANVSGALFRSLLKGIMNGCTVSDVMRGLVPEDWSPQSKEPKATSCTETKESRVWAVQLLDFRMKKIAAIKAVRAAGTKVGQSLGLKEAKELVESPMPVTLFKNLTPYDVQAVKDSFSENQSDASLKIEAQ